MKRSGTTDLALFGGRIPPWLFDRMKALCLPVVESVIQEYGTTALLSRLSDPYWFQSFGAVIGIVATFVVIVVRIFCVCVSSVIIHSCDGSIRVMIIIGHSCNCD